MPTASSRVALCAACGVLFCGALASQAAMVQVASRAALDADPYYAHSWTPGSVPLNSPVAMTDGSVTSPPLSVTPSDTDGQSSWAAYAGPTWGENFTDTVAYVNGVGNSAVFVFSSPIGEFGTQVG